MSYSYLASPYSHEKAEVRKERYEQISHIAGLYMLNKFPVFSPIAHSHPISLKYKLPTDFTFWQEHCIAMLHNATALWVIQLPDWDSSEGVKEEIKYALKNNVPVAYIDPKTPFNHLFLSFAS